jgi:hypothetical protein
MTELRAQKAELKPKLASMEADYRKTLLIKKVKLEATLNIALKQRNS